METDRYIQDLKDRISAVVQKCWNCNFCYSACPNFDSTRGFQTQGPSGMTQALSYAVRWDRFEGEDAADLARIVYACTTCNSCVRTCARMSAGVSLLDAVEAGRQLLVEMMKGPLPRQRHSLERLDKYGNPYGKPKKQRLAWATERPLPLVGENGPEVQDLLFVGCSVALNPELAAIGTGVAALLEAAGINFGVLEDEVCCGDPARTLGDHFLLEELIEKNRGAFVRARPKRIITLSPHCLTTMKRHYRELPENCDIVHYTEVLEECLPVLEPVLQKRPALRATFHDPCYLGKHNDLYEPPRRVIAALGEVELVEMADHHENSLCCGGGGGRMFEEVEETVRLGRRRVEQALESGAEVLVTACPWCYQMLSEAVKDARLGGQLRVVDVAEFLAERLCVC